MHVYTRALYARAHARIYRRDGGRRVGARGSTAARFTRTCASTRPTSTRMRMRLDVALGAVRARFIGDMDVKGTFNTYTRKHTHSLSLPLSFSRARGAFDAKSAKSKPVSHVVTLEPRVPIHASRIGCNERLTEGGKVSSESKRAVEANRLNDTFQRDKNFV